MIRVHADVPGPSGAYPSLERQMCRCQIEASRNRGIVTIRQYEEGGGMHTDDQTLCQEETLDSLPKECRRRRTGCRRA
jgi:hypothetical protein